MRTVCWFSCGAASAVATKLTLAEESDALVVRVSIAEEHPDNDRFAQDCAAWFGVGITTLTSEKYAATPGGRGSIYEVFHKERYLGPGGAHCTKKLKKRVRESFEQHGDVQVFGYTSDEQDRVDRFLDANAHVLLRCPLIERGLDKAACLTMIQRAGIELPMMYRLGYGNNNCVGCVKGGAGYWNKIRVDFKETFDRMAQTEEALGRTVCKVGGKRVTLRQLPPDAGNHKADSPGECGIFCYIAERSYS